MNHAIRITLMAVVLIVALFVWRQNQISLNEMEEESATSEQEFFDEHQFISTNGIVVQAFSPNRHEVISSPLSIQGEAPGTWFFEGSAPIVLVNWDGVIVAQGYVEAQDDWMTEDVIAFEGEMTFTDIFPQTEEELDFEQLEEFMKKGTLILKKSNPSGMPEKDDAIEIPIRFSL